jgi:hypothetical protein
VGQVIRQQAHLDRNQSNKKTKSSGPPKKTRNWKGFSQGV